MMIYGISIWGVVLMAFLLLTALGVFWVIDRRQVLRTLRLLVVGIGQLVALAACIWGVYRLDSWWANVLWDVFLSVVCSFLITSRLRLSVKSFLPVLAVSVVVVSMAFGGCLLLCFDAMSAKHLFVPVVSLLIGALLPSSTVALREYLIALRHTEVHRRYLQANGANHLEAIASCVRRAMRAAVLPLLRPMASPLFLAMPPLFGGMLLCGMDVWAALVATLLMMMATLSAAISTVVVMLWLSDRYLFDQSGTYRL